MVAGAAVVLLTITTFQRNADYQSSLSIWLDTIAKAPANARAYNSVATALVESHCIPEALPYYNRAIELDPQCGRWYSNRGNALYALAQYQNAIADYDRALALDSTLAGAYLNRAVSRYFLQQFDDAWADIRRAKSFGFHPHPDFIRALSRASGRRDDAFANTPIEPQ
jgi:tetratricopeptide (TPR) repeat protein